MSLTILPSLPSWKLDSGSPLPAMTEVEMLSSSASSEDCGMVAVVNATSKTQLQFTGTSLKLHGYITNDRSHGDFSAASAQVDGVSALIYPPVGSFCTQLASWDNLDPSVTHTLNFGPFNASFGQYLLKYADYEYYNFGRYYFVRSSASDLSQYGRVRLLNLPLIVSTAHERSIIVGSVVGGFAPPDRGINPLKAKLTEARPRMDSEGRGRRGERDSENERLRNALAALQSEMQELRLGNEGTETLPDYESRDE
ncbi:hypothetical protein EXIGLDRAFT_694724 [Exidia glandulosa HHB12029]|uniref:Uncharacterized protein n=1 Tax=Exidia glandulosa HHB12029 TaxID=1314781 RepID=A0A166ABI5_EXIGL|nr:hypothetical protein EXIGLDRAFT_694724 [Exidia glandulosa HHB12029]